MLVGLQGPTIKNQEFFQEENLFSKSPPLAPCSRGTRSVPSAVGGRARQGLSEGQFIQNGCQRQPFWKNFEKIWKISKFFLSVKFAFKHKFENNQPILSSNPIA